jgi:hypothetical protein
MRERYRQIFRIFVVLGIGVSLAGMAGQFSHQDKPVMRAKKMRPEPIIWATVIEGSVPEECLAAPRDNGRPAKKKAIACG